jgi:hypothetical protein
MAGKQPQSLIVTLDELAAFATSEPVRVLEVRRALKWGARTSGQQELVTRLVPR